MTERGRQDGTARGGRRAEMTALWDTHRQMGRPVGSSGRLTLDKTGSVLQGRYPPHQLQRFWTDAGDAIPGAGSECGDGGTCQSRGWLALCPGQKPGGCRDRHDWQSWSRSQHGPTCRLMKMVRNTALWRRRGQGRIGGQAVRTLLTSPEAIKGTDCSTLPAVPRPESGLDSLTEEEAMFPGGRIPH